MRTLHLVHYDNRFLITGGPLASPQTAGWHIVDDKGHTVGVCNSDDVAKRWNALEALAASLKQVDGLHWLGEAVDQGFIEIDSEEWHGKLLPLMKIAID